MANVLDGYRTYIDVCVVISFQQWIQIVIQVDQFYKNIDITFQKFGANTH